MPSNWDGGTVKNQQATNSGEAKDQKTANNDAVKNESSTDNGVVKSQPTNNNEGSRSMPQLETLNQIESILIHQLVSVCEVLCSWEVENRYLIFDARRRTLAYKAYERKSWNSGVLI